MCKNICIAIKYAKSLDLGLGWYQSDMWWIVMMKQSDIFVVFLTGDNPVVECYLVDIEDSFGRLE